MKYIYIYVESQTHNSCEFVTILAPVPRVLVRRPRKESEQNAKRRKPASAAGIESIASVRHVVVRQGERGREGREGGKLRAHAVRDILDTPTRGPALGANARALRDTDGENPAFPASQNIVT